MSDRRLVLVYDKECPACNFYCQLIRIRESVGELELVDAREDSEYLERITDQGLDIDQGMVLIVDEQLYYGSDAIHALSLMSSRSGFFNRINYWIFRSSGVASLLYPILRSGRNLLLKILGRTKINNLSIENNTHF